MSSLIERRMSMHRQLEESEKTIDNLKDQLQATQKLASMGTMAGLAAHEFNNILMPMINYAELALKHPDDQDLMTKALEKIIKHGKIASQIIQSMLGVMRTQSKNHELIELTPIVEECFQSLARNFKKDNIDVTVSIPEGMTVSVVPGQFQQVLLNLIINARQALLKRGGRLSIHAVEQDGGSVRIDIADSGCGIEPEIMERIFEPFFSTKTAAEKPSERGTGLGLSVCKDIIEAHDGTLSVESQVSVGTTFTIILPKEKKS